MATFNYSKIKEKWTKKNIQKSKQEEYLRKTALEKAKKVALFLKNHYQVTNVYLYGSLVWGKHYTSISDIDLMIEGFPPDQRYYRALAMAESMAQPISIQLVLSEDAFPDLIKRVKKEGILL